MTTPIRILRSRGIRPRKQLGQCFLQDNRIAVKIVDLSCIRKDETVVEIGAGLGIMTGLIAAKARRVIALDVDPIMIGILKERLGSLENVEVLEADVLQYDFHSAVPPEPPETIAIVGNLPYFISSPILFRLLDFRSCISRMVVMLQREVADRIVAKPGTKAYGIPTVIVSMFCRTQRLMDVPAGCFYPEPKVVSSVVKLEVREEPLTDLKDEALFCDIVRLAFAKRRKTLVNNLRHARLPGYPAEVMLSALKNSGIDGMRRAETLSAEEFGALTNCMVAQEKAQEKA